MDAEERQAEFEPHRLLDENADAPGGEQRIEHAAIEAADDDAFDRKPEQRRHDEGQRNGDQNAGAQPQARHHRRVRADHHQFAMGHVDHAHDAVGDGEPQRHEQQNGPDAQADEQRIDHGITDAAAERRRPLFDPVRSS